MPQPTVVPPTPTVAPESVDAPAPGSATQDGEEIIKEACTVGQAVVERDSATFYSAANPASERRLLTTYPKGTEVTLLGSCYIGWVKVQPENAVTPGWMFAPDLKLTRGTSTDVTTSDATSTNSSTTSAVQPTSSNESSGSTTNSTAATPPAAPVQVVKRAVQPPPAPSAVQRQTLTITVRVVDQEQRAVSGVNVLLVNAFGQQLIDALTPADGQIVFTPDLAPKSVVRVQLPAIGISVPVDPASPVVTVTLPRGNG